MDDTVFDGVSDTVKAAGGKVSYSIFGEFTATVQLECNGKVVGGPWKSAGSIAGSYVANAGDSLCVRFAGLTGDPSSVVCSIGGSPVPVSFVATPVISVPPSQ